jgi:hypothetical protein
MDDQDYTLLMTGNAAAVVARNGSAQSLKTWVRPSR